MGLQTCSTGIGLSVYQACSATDRTDFFVLGLPTKHSFAHGDKVTRGCYGEVVNFRMGLSENDVEEKQLRQALEKWYVVFATGEDAWPRGFDLRNAVRLHRLEDMKTVLWK